MLYRALESLLEKQVVLSFRAELVRKRTRVASRHRGPCRLRELSKPAGRKICNGNHHHIRRHQPLLQGLGAERRAACDVSPRLAAQRRRLGQSDAVLSVSRLSCDRARPAWPRPIRSDRHRQRHGYICFRRGVDRPGAGSARCHSYRPFHRRGRGRALCCPRRARPYSQGRPDRRCTTCHGPVGRESGWYSDGGFRRIPRGAVQEPRAVLHGCAKRTVLWLQPRRR